VEVLDKAFAAIDQAKANLEQNIANAKELFQSKLDAIFDCSMDNGGLIMDNSVAASSPLRKYWEERTLESCLTSQPRNGWSPPAAHHAASGIPVLTLSAVTGFNFREDKVKYTSAQTDPERHYWVENGDLLITRSNTPELVGHVAIAKGIMIPTVYPDLIMKMKTDLSILTTKFAYWQLRSPRLRKIIMERASGANPTMKKVNQTAVKTLPLRIPSIPLQKSIASQLDRFHTETQSLKVHYQTKLTSLDELKKSILQKAFRGQLTGDNG
jgi:type I restriction enzyme S subunit